MSEKIQNELNKLPVEIRWHLQRADGFLDLKMTGQARAELDRIPAELRGAAIFRIIDMRLACEEKDWARAAQIMSVLCEEFPADAGFRIQLAYAKRRAEGIEVARRILADAAPLFPKVATIPFNLACYECQLGNLDEAMRKLQQAFALDGSYREAALEDEDLRALWPRLEG